MKIKKSLSPIAFHCKSSFANALQELTSIDGNINRVFCFNRNRKQIDISAFSMSG